MPREKPRDDAGDDHPADTRRGIQSLEVGLRVASVLASAEGPLALRDVARASGLAAGAAHRYLVSLIRASLAIQTPDGRYDLGGLALRLGFARLARLDAMGVAERGLEAFVEGTGTSALLAIWSERGPIVLRWMQGRRPVYTTIGLGSVLPLDRSATGAVFLAWQDPALLAALLDRRRLMRLSGRAAAVRQAGRAEASGSLVPGLHAVAVPVFDGRGGLFAAITAVAAGDPLSKDAIEALVRQGAHLSAELGFGAPPPSPPAPPA